MNLVTNNRNRALNERGPEPENSRNLPDGFNTAWLCKTVMDTDLKILLTTI